MLPQVSDYNSYEVMRYAWQRERCLIRQLNKKPFPQDFDVAIAVEFGDPRSTPVWFAKHLGPRVHEEHHMIALLAVSLLS